MSNRIALLTGLALALSTSICQAQNFAIQYRGPTHSGFLSSYDNLRPDDNADDVLLYVTEDTDLSTYDKIIVNAVEIWYDPHSVYKGIRPDDLTEITQSARDLMIAHLGKSVAVVNRPGPNTVLLNLALTNVFAKHPDRRIISAAPIGLAKIGIDKARGKDYVISAAQMEGEAIDVSSGKLLGKIVVLSLGEKDKKDNTSWEAVLATLEQYAVRLSDRLAPRLGSATPKQ